MLNTRPGLTALPVLLEQGDGSIVQREQPIITVAALGALAQKVPLAWSWRRDSNPEPGDYERPGC
jgi:hypothetical protein